MASAIFALNQIREIEGSREERKRARDREREVFLDETNTRIPETADSGCFDRRPDARPTAPLVHCTSGEKQGQRSRRRVAGESRRELVRHPKRGGIA